MKKYYLIILSVLLLSSIDTYSQSLSLDGKVFDKQDNALLGYASIRVLETMKGTTTNSEGEFRIYLKPGSYKLAASYIGYNSDTVSVILSADKTGVNFYLEKSTISFPTLVVAPGINPALAIIKKAIAKKEERAGKLNSYKTEIFTKGVFRSNQENAGKPDSLKSKVYIVGILENTGVSYFKKPDYHKDVIIARKQTANFPPEINVLSGNRMMQSFYENKINFFDIPLPGPIAKNALDYYDYYIADSTSIDNRKVFQIHINSLNENDPGFTGSVFILDKSFDLIKVDVELNRAANVGGLFDTLRIFQQFQMYDSLYMPVDYRIIAKINLMGLIKFGVDLNSVMYDYQINTPEKDSLFNKAVLTVLQNADEKDSTYWQNSGFIPTTNEERRAYTRIDSILNAPKPFWKGLLYNLSQGGIIINKNFSFVTPLEMYHFNRVEGHTIDFGVTEKDLFAKRLNSNFKIHYGFDDRKTKTEFETGLLLGDYRTYKISFNAFSSLLPLFNEDNYFTDFVSSLYALAFKDDFLDYYYSKGIGCKISGDIFPVLNAGIGFNNRTDNTAYKNTDFSFSDNDKSYRKNPPIYEARINSIDLNFDFDIRNYIENGYFRTRVSDGASYFTFGGGITFSSKGFLNSDMNFKFYRANIEGVINSFRITNLDYKLSMNYTNDALPYQMMFALPGSIQGICGKNTFRTVKLGEYFGSKVIIANLNYNFYDEFFRLFPVPIIKNWNLQVSAFLNAGWMEISSKCKDILPVRYKTLDNPLVEVGFGIGYSLFPMKLEFAWRLTNTNENAFTVGINTALMLK